MKANGHKKKTCTIFAFVSSPISTSYVCLERHQKNNLIVGELFHNFEAEKVLGPCPVFA